MEEPEWIIESCVEERTHGCLKSFCLPLRESAHISNKHRRDVAVCDLQKQAKTKVSSCRVAGNLTLSTKHDDTPGSTIFLSDKLKERTKRQNIRRKTVKWQ